MPGDQMRGREGGLGRTDGERESQRDSVFVCVSVPGGKEVQISRKIVK